MTFNQQEYFNFIENQTHLYNLQSIIVHRGSFEGGHYYTYVKDFTAKCWILFDDATVSLVSVLYKLELITN